MNACGGVGSAGYDSVPEHVLSRQVGVFYTLGRISSKARSVEIENHFTNSGKIACVCRIDCEDDAVTDVYYSVGIEINQTLVQELKRCERHLVVNCEVCNV